MAEVQTNVVVYTTPEHVEEFSRYAESWPDWFTGVVAAQPDAAYPAEGSTVIVTFEAANTTFDITLTVNEYVPGEMVTFAMSGMANGTLGFYNAYTDDDGIEVTAYVDYTLPGGVLGQIADATVVERRVHANFESALDNMYNMIHN